MIHPEKAGGTWLMRVSVDDKQGRLIAENTVPLLIKRPLSLEDVLELWDQGIGRLPVSKAGEEILRNRVKLAIKDGEEPDIESATYRSWTLRVSIEDSFDDLYIEFEFETRYAVRERDRKKGP